MHSFTKNVVSIPHTLVLCFLCFLQEVKAFNMMLGRLLNAGYISQARELAALFEHDSPDLTIVLVLYSVHCHLIRAL